MGILADLSSQVGDRTEASNKDVAARCLHDPRLLEQIALGLGMDEYRLLGDCAEVMTEVAREHPAAVAPYADQLVPLLAHARARVRWEAMHALALVAALRPDTIEPLLPRFAVMLQEDESVIVRDHIPIAAGNYAQTGEVAAQAVYPLLVEALTAWNMKHTKYALAGLEAVAQMAPARRAEIHALATTYADHPKAAVRTAARRLAKATVP